MKNTVTAPKIQVEMVDGINKNLSEEELFFYEDRVCGEADLVYRFCFALTLAPAPAFELLQHAFRKTAREIAQLLDMNDAELRIQLSKNAMHSLEKVSAKGGANSTLAKFLEPLAVESRAVLVARDVVGLTSAEIAHVLERDESKVVDVLADARKKLEGF